ncbi:IGR protein motif [Quillaja saponaria]|uniref:IGR protein motif n=1 Tax=Quillaja saponaria TaxID=32244 RepID=A0AAD7VF19_QUISA|nr:IGR protein motif [Quillaja saponaria]
MAWMRGILNKRAISAQIQPHSSPCFYRFFSKSSTYVVKVGIPEFLNGIGKGLETHVAKLDSEIGDFQKLLVTRTLKLKKLGVPCKHVITPHLHLLSLHINRKPYLTIHIPTDMQHICVRKCHASCDSQIQQIMRKLILKYSHKYRLGLWRPRSEPVKS